MDAAKIADWLVDNPQEWGRVAEFVAQGAPAYARQIGDTFADLAWEYEENGDD